MYMIMNASRYQNQTVILRIVGSRHKFIGSTFCRSLYKQDYVTFKWGHKIKYNNIITYKYLRVNPKVQNSSF